MQQGIHIKGYGDFPMRDRADIDGPGLQRALAASHGVRQSVRCLCCAGTGHLISMEVIKLTYQGRTAIGLGPVTSAEPRYRVDRVHISDQHHPACIFRLPNDDLDHERPVPSSLMFAQGNVMPTAVGVGLGRNGRGSMRFTSFARALMSKGYTFAWSGANLTVHSFGELRNPSALEVLEAIDDAIRNTPLRDVDDAYLGAEKNGSGLVFGLWEARLPEGQFQTASFDVPVLLAGYRQRRLDNFYALIPPGLLDKLGRSVQIGHNHVEPPYLFFAVIEPDWRIQKMCIQPVYFDGEFMVFVESTLERRHFAYLVRQGAKFFRALDSMRDYEEMPKRLQIISLDRGEQWPYCPDVIIYDETESSIEEWRGFAKGRIPDYDELMSRKADEYPLFIGDRAPVKYVERDPGFLAGVDHAGTCPRHALPPLRRGVVTQALPEMVLV